MKSSVSITSNRVKLPGRVLHQTTKAIQFEYSNPLNTALTLTEWIPYSQVSEIHDDYIVISNWLARKIGIK